MMHHAKIEHRFLPAASVMPPALDPGKVNELHDSTSRHHNGTHSVSSPCLC